MCKMIRLSLGPNLNLRLNHVNHLKNNINVQHIEYLNMLHNNMSSKPWCEDTFFAKIPSLTFAACNKSLFNCNKHFLRESSKICVI